MGILSSARDLSLPLRFPVRAWPAMRLSVLFLVSLILTASTASSVEEDVRPRLLHLVNSAQASASAVLQSVTSPSVLASKSALDKMTFEVRPGFVASYGYAC